MQLFYWNFERICHERGTTPTALVKSMGLTSARVTQWKANLPKKDELCLIAKALNCSVMEFFMEEKDLRESRSTVRDGDEGDIIRIYRALDRRRRHEFMNIVYGFEKRADIG